MKEEIKAGQYWVARYRGTGGDLLVGRVESVRNGRRKKNGEKGNQKVICTNLITGKPSTKDIEIFRTRNKHVKKNQADAILRVYEELGRPAAREEAVKMKSPYERDKQQELPLDQPRGVKQGFIISITTDGLDGPSDMKKIAEDLARFIPTIVMPYVREVSPATVAWIDRRSKKGAIK